MEKEKIQILKMVESGKLSAQEAVDLLAALDEPGESSGAPAVPRKAKKRWFKIRVYEGGDAKPKVNITLPLGLFKIASKIIPGSAQLQLKEKNLNLEDIFASIDEIEDGKILEVQDNGDNERVEILVE